MLGLSLGGALSALPYLALGAAAFIAYDRLVDDPAVRREARRNYVTQATVAAVNAELAETRRQLAAAQNVAIKWARSAAELREQQDKQDAQDTIDATDYEAKLDAATRACRRLGKRDLEFLSR